MRFMKKNSLYENEHLFIEVEKSEIPWLKIFTQEAYRELSQVPLHVKMELFEKLDIIEKEMLDYYNPTKINIASFGNYLPHVHFHVMARFEEDAYFPEPMWGKQQRESALVLKNFETFLEGLVLKLHR